MTDSPEAPFSARTQALLDFRGRLDDLRINQHTTFDKTLVTLSTGGIGLSVLLFQWIAERQDLVGVSIMVTSWIVLLVGLLCNLASYLTSAEDVRNEISRIDEEISSGEAVEDAGNLFRSVTKFLNWIALACFTLGTASLLTFAYLNTVGDYNDQAQATARWWHGDGGRSVLNAATDSA